MGGAIAVLFSTCVTATLLDGTKILAMRAETMTSVRPASVVIGEIALSAAWIEVLARVAPARPTVPETEVLALTAILATDERTAALIRLALVLDAMLVAALSDVLAAFPATDLAAKKDVPKRAIEPDLTTAANVAILVAAAIAVLPLSLPLPVLVILVAPSKEVAAATDALAEFLMNAVANKKMAPGVAIAANVAMAVRADRAVVATTLPPVSRIEIATVAVSAIVWSSVLETVVTAADVLAASLLENDPVALADVLIAVEPAMLAIAAD